MEMADQPPRRRLPLREVSPSTSQRQVESASHQDVLNWWQRFRISHPYPVYCLFFIRDVDKEAALFINEHGYDIANISGEHCLIVFFHYGSNIEDSDQIDIQASSITIVDLARVLNISYDDMPCAVFFEDMFSGLRVVVNLRDRTSNSILELFRGLFRVLQNEKHGDKLDLLWEHQFERDNPSLIKRVLKSALSIVRDLRARFSS